MGTVQLPRFSELPAKGNPTGLTLLYQLAPGGDRGLTFSRGHPDGVMLGKIPGYWTCPYLGTITGVILNTDRGGYIVKFWKAAGRTPTAEDSITLDGYSIRPPATHIELFNLTGFTEIDVAPGDTFAVEIVEVHNPIPTDIAGNVLVVKREEDPH